MHQTLAKVLQVEQQWWSSETRCKKEIGFVSTFCRLFFLFGLWKTPNRWHFLKLPRALSCFEAYPADTKLSTQNCLAWQSHQSNFLLSLAQMNWSLPHRCYPLRCSIRTCPEAEASARCNAARHQAGPRAKAWREGKWLGGSTGLTSSGSECFVVLGKNNIFPF